VCFELSEEIDRYPVKSFTYFQSIGRLLEHRLGQIFQELGYQTTISKGQSNGVDLKVYNQRELLLVAEVLNFSVYSELSDKRKNSIVTNLSEYNCRKLLIYSCMANENIINDLGLYEISSLKIGYQLQPKHFYDYFAARNKTKLREVDSRETRQDLETKIVTFLHSFGLEIQTIPCQTVPEFQVIL
jgi:hypothetical protein